MDSLTHVVLGAAVAEAVIGRKEGNKAILWGAVIGTIPDLDVLFSGLYGPVKSLLVHRGFSHSIFFVLLVSPLIGYLLFKINRKSHTSLKRWILMAYLVLGTHIFLDLFTTYGTGIFEPFSHYRAEWSTISIIDVFYTIPFLISVLLFTFFRRGSSARKIINLTGITLSSLYLLFTVVNKSVVTGIFKSSFNYQEIGFSKVKTVPMLFTNFLWMGIAEQPDSYAIGYYSIFDDDKNISIEIVQKNAVLLDNLKRYPQIRDVIRFTKGFYTVNFKSGMLIINDLRFGRMGFTAQSPFIFSFAVNRVGDKLQVTENHPEPAEGGAFLHEYLKRIAGK